MAHVVTIVCVLVFVTSRQRRLGRAAVQGMWPSTFCRFILVRFEAGVGW